MIRTILSLSFILWFAFGLTFVKAQTFKIVGPEKSKVLVTGTSTLHGWTATAKKFGFQASPFVLKNGNLEPVEAFYLKVEVSSLEGGRGASMDKKIYDAFDGDNHPLIEFKQVEMIKGERHDDGTFQFVSRGNLSMAGVTNEVELELEGKLTSEGLTIKCLYDMRMSDFSIERPSAMFGQIVCGDDVTVNIELFFEKEN